MDDDLQLRHGVSFAFSMLPDDRRPGKGMLVSDGKVLLGQLAIQIIYFSSGCSEHGSRVGDYTEGTRRGCCTI